jgi:hypothetical protein
LFSVRFPYGGLITGWAGISFSPPRAATNNGRRTPDIDIGADGDPKVVSTELNLAQAQLNERLALVQLYNALGGGWQ